MLHEKSNTLSEGTPLAEANRVLILLHGRGASAQDILSLTHYLNVIETHLLAPQATNFSWYPQSFLAPEKHNEPWLTSALDLIDSLIEDLLKAGKTLGQVVLLGFSQGACLTLEYAARHAKPYGGVAALTGGLIGESLDYSRYSGDFEGAPVFIGNSDIDPHVPLARSRESGKILEDLGASVTLKVYPGMGHTIIQEELNILNNLILR
jgi:phospholipase/carboxylesterase